LSQIDVNSFRVEVTGQGDFTSDTIFYDGGTLEEFDLEDIIHINDVEFTAVDTELTIVVYFDTTFTFDLGDLQETLADKVIVDDPGDYPTIDPVQNPIVDASSEGQEEIPSYFLAGCSLSIVDLDNTSSFTLSGNEYCGSRAGNSTEYFDNRDFEAPGDPLQNWSCISDPDGYCNYTSDIVFSGSYSLRLNATNNSGAGAGTQVGLIDSLSFWTYTAREEDDDDLFAILIKYYNITNSSDEVFQVIIGPSDSVYGSLCGQELAQDAPVYLLCFDPPGIGYWKEFTYPVAHLLADTSFDQGQVGEVHLTVTVQSKQGAADYYFDNFTTIGFDNYKCDLDNDGTSDGTSIHGRCIYSGSCPSGMTCTSDLCVTGQCKVSCSPTGSLCSLYDMAKNSANVSRCASGECCFEDYTDTVTTIDWSGNEECGCSGNDGKYCDTNHDGSTEGVCISSSCCQKNTVEPDGSTINYDGDEACGCSAGSSETIDNGDFETGDLTNWTSDNERANVTDEYAHGGSYSLRVYANGTNSGNARYKNLTGKPPSLEGWVYIPSVNKTCTDCASAFRIDTYNSSDPSNKYASILYIPYASGAMDVYCSIGCIQPDECLICPEKASLDQWTKYAFTVENDFNSTFSSHTWDNVVNYTIEIATLAQADRLVTYWDDVAVGGTEGFACDLDKDGTTAEGTCVAGSCT
jgi:hypothetical protein